MAYLCGLIHFIPISATVFLVFLNWRGYYIGQEMPGRTGEDGAKFFGLQLAVKLHELTISPSLTAVIRLLTMRFRAEF